MDRPVQAEQFVKIDFLCEMAFERQIPKDQSVNHYNILPSASAWSVGQPHLTGCCTIPVVLDWALEIFAN